MANQKKAMSTKNLVMYAVLTAITFVLQYVSMFIRTGTFSITLSLVPIVIGAAILGIRGGMWLGLVFGFAVLISGDAASFMVVHPLGTVLTVVTLVMGNATFFLLDRLLGMRLRRRKR